MKKFLIAGLGSIGRRHLRNLLALGEADIILLRSHRSTMPNDELAGFPVETEVREALRKHGPDAVIVANPTATHLDVAIPAAEAGCCLFLEKPISHSLDRVELFERTVARTGARVQVGFQLRNHPMLVLAREHIRSGRLGRVVSCRVSFSEYLPSWHPWEDYRMGYAARADLGGGVLRTQCHSLDYLPWLIGEVESVWGYLAKLSDLELDVEDTAEIGMRFAHGALGSLHIDFAQPTPAHNIAIHGTRRTLKCDLRAGTVRLYEAESNECEVANLPQGWERNHMFLEEMREFVNVVRGLGNPTCTLEDGIKVMQLITAVEDANLSGRRISLRS